MKLKHLDAWTAARQDNANQYDRLFEQNGLAGNQIILPTIRQNRHIFNQYIIRAQNRDTLKTHLQEHRIGTEIYYPVPMHLQDCFRYLGHKPGDFPASEEAARSTLALPIYPELTDEQLRATVDCTRSFYDETP